ncbi:MAG: RHS repeat protein, partial [Actinobacteria bacterium]|nr:RHS repeat protein [Actinomycetota bacterium]
MTLNPDPGDYWQSGYLDDQVNAVDILPKPVNPAPSVSTSASAWFREVDRDEPPDGLPDFPCDANGVGRGAVQLSWSASPLADGYGIYCYDGGAYQKVGEVFGNATTSWSSAGAGFYPPDSEINGWSDNGYTGNPFYRATMPDDPAAASLQPSGLAGAGLTLSDGSYLYVRRWSGQPGPSSWTRVGTGYGGTTAGALYGTVGPDLSSAPARSAFYLDQCLWNGSVTFVGGRARVRGVHRKADAEAPLRSLSFSEPPLNCATGAPLSQASSEVLLASDGEQIYSLAYSCGSGYDGYKIRQYAASGAHIADHQIDMTSELIDGVLADGTALYLLEWTGSNGAHITKVSTSSWQPVNRWSIDQGTSRAVGGCHDALNDCFWLGALDSGTIYRYSGPGRDLRDNPRALYRKTDGTTYDNNTNYWFRVVPYNEIGAVGLYENAAAVPTLDKRTLGVTEAPQHSAYDLGSFAAHRAEALLDAGALQIETTDLQIASWGPPAALQRCYSSARTTSTAFAPGWQFGFERKLLFVSDTVIDYLDHHGEANRFHKEAGLWVSPNGLPATLIQDSSQWLLTTKDRNTLRFDSSGRLLAESDGNENTVTYSWSGADLTTITAANGQTISVSMSSGQIGSASYATADGTRTVTYSGGASPQVTYFPGQAEEHAVQYGYADGRLSSLTALAWKSDPLISPSQSFAYDGSDRLCDVYFADYDAQSRPDARLHIAYGAAGARSATVSRWGTVEGTANVEVSQLYQWNPTGTLAGKTDPRTAAEQAASWSYAYAPDNQLLSELAPDGGERHCRYDARGNLTVEYDEQDDRTSYAYAIDDDLFDPLTRMTDAEGGRTFYEYDSHGNLTKQERTLDADGTRSCAEYGHDGQGRLTLERHKISASEWAETDYDENGFALGGEPKRIIYRAVRLYDPAAPPPDPPTSPQDLMLNRSYDAFGNLVAESDAAGTTIATNSYDLAGRLLSSTGPSIAGAGAISQQHRYDSLGYETASWTQTDKEGLTAIKASWAETDYDALGRSIAERTRLSSVEQPNGPIAAQTLRSYDGMGREIAVDEGAEGLPGRSDYDARGNLTRQWA